MLGENEFVVNYFNFNETDKNPKRKDIFKILFEKIHMLFIRLYNMKTLSISLNPF